MVISEYGPLTRAPQTMSITWTVTEMPGQPWVATISLSPKAGETPGRQGRTSAPLCLPPMPPRQPREARPDLEHLLTYGVKNPTLANVVVQEHLGEEGEGSATSRLPQALRLELEVWSSPPLPWKPGVTSLLFLFTPKPVCLYLSQGRRGPDMVTYCVPFPKKSSLISNCNLLPFPGQEV